MSDQQSVLFVCVHNAGRSQMAETLFNSFAAKVGLNFVAESAGTVPGHAINPVAKDAMAEIGLPMDANFPKLLTQAMADRALTVITMGCGVEARACPARFILTDDWGLDDPAGMGIDEVRVIRDQIAERVRQLVYDLRGEP